MVGARTGIILVQGIRYQESCTQKNAEKCQGGSNQIVRLTDPWVNIIAFSIRVAHERRDRHERRC